MTKSQISTRLDALKIYFEKRDCHIGSGLDFQLIFRIVKVPRGLQAAESLQPMMKSDIAMCNSKQPDCFTRPTINHHLASDAMKNMKLEESEKLWCPIINMQSYYIKLTFLHSLSRQEEEVCFIL